MTPVAGCNTLAVSSGYPVAVAFPIRRYIVFLGAPGAPDQYELSPKLADLGEATRAAREESKGARAFVWDDDSNEVVARFANRESIRAEL